MSDYKQLYELSLETARHENEVPLWRESLAENVRCARAIENMIAERFNDNKLDGNCARDIISEFGYDRVNFVLKNTIACNKDDGRISDANKEWAKSFSPPDKSHMRDFCVNSHLALLDGFVNQARKEWDNLGLYDSSHCDSIIGENLEGRILVLNPHALKDEYKTPKDQLFLATGGFGCEPDKIGTKVYGKFLSDGEETTFHRYDFIGIIKDENIPDWVRTKYEAFSEMSDDTAQSDDGIVMQ